MIIRLQSRAQAHFSKKTIFQKINPNKIDHLCASLQGGENCFRRAGEESWSSLWSRRRCSNARKRRRHKAKQDYRGAPQRFRGSSDGRSRKHAGDHRGDEYILLILGFTGRFFQLFAQDGELYSLALRP
jgi:hypothetical protein